MAADNPFDAALRKGKHRGKLADRIPPASPPITAPPGALDAGQTVIPRGVLNVGETVIPRGPEGIRERQVQPPPPGMSPGIWDKMTASERAAASSRMGNPAAGPRLTEEQHAAWEENERRRIAGSPGILRVGDNSLLGLMRKQPGAIDESGGGYRPAQPHGELPAQPVDYADPNAIATSGQVGASPTPGIGVGGGTGGGGGGPAPGPHEEWRVGPSVRGAFGEADTAAQEAIAARAGQAGQAGQDEAAAFERLQHEQAARAAQTELREKDRRAVLMSYQEQADTLADEAASQKIDSGRLWASKNTGEKIAGIASMVLGGFLQGLHGGRNDAADAFDREIQRDIDEQVANIQLKGAAAERAKGLVGIAMGRFSDQRAAEGAAYSAALAQAELELKRQAALNKGDAAQVFAKDAIAALQQRRAERLSQMVAFVQPTGGGGGSASTGGLYPGEAGKMVDIGGGNLLEVSTVQDAEKIRARQAYESNIRQLQDEAAAVYKQYGKTAIVNPIARARLAQIREAALPIQSLATGQGVVREFERDPTFNALGLNYTAKDILLGRDPLKLIEGAKKTLGGGSESMIQQNGQNGVVVRQHMVQKPNGDIVRKYEYVRGGSAQGSGAAPPAPAAPPSFQRRAGP